MWLKPNFYDARNMLDLKLEVKQKFAGTKIFAILDTIQMGLAIPFCIRKQSVYVVLVYKFSLKMVINFKCITLRAAFLCKGNLRFFFC